MVNAQAGLKDSVWLIYEGKSIVKSFESISKIQSDIPIYVNDFFIVDPIIEKFDTSQFIVYETKFPFGKGNCYEFEEGKDYYLHGEVNFIVSNDDDNVHGIFAFWTVLEKHDSLVNTPEYACALINIVANQALPGIKNMVKCEDYWNYEVDNDFIYQKVVLEAPEPEEDFDLEPIYYVTYEARFK